MGRHFLCLQRFPDIEHTFFAVLLSDASVSQSGFLGVTKRVSPCCIVAQINAVPEASMQIKCFLLLCVHRLHNPRYDIGFWIEIRMNSDRLCVFPRMLLYARGYL